MEAKAYLTKNIEYIFDNKENLEVFLKKCIKIRSFFSADVYKYKGKEFYFFNNHIEKNGVRINIYGEEPVFCELKDIFKHIDTDFDFHNIPKTEKVKNIVIHIPIQELNNFFQNYSTELEKYNFEKIGKNHLVLKK